MDNELGKMSVVCPLDIFVGTILKSVTQNEYSMCVCTHNLTKVKSCLVLSTGFSTETHSLDAGTCSIVATEVVNPLVYQKLATKLNLHRLPA